MISDFGLITVLFSTVFFISFLGDTFVLPLYEEAAADGPQSLKTGKERSCVLSLSFFVH
jgi:hypothetical protein